MVNKYQQLYSMRYTGEMLFKRIAASLCTNTNLEVNYIFFKFLFYGGRSTPGKVNTIRGIPENTTTVYVYVLPVLRVVSTRPEKVLRNLKRT